MVSSNHQLTETHIPGSANWLAALRTYLAVSGLGHLAWETGQLPLYTIWSTGTVRELVFAVVHCTVGDILIALATLAAALVLMGNSTWPSQGFGSAYLLTSCFGVGYTVLSEWLNTGVRGNWAYSAWMPTLPWTGTGLSPLLQWVLIPTLALFASRHLAGRTISSIPSRACSLIQRGLTRRGAVD
jgi:hypothetical protein